VAGAPRPARQLRRGLHARRRESGEAGGRHSRASGMVLGA
jgi:hypothetical protein